MKTNELIYGLNDKPAAPACLAAAFQHMLASFVGVITPTLIITAALDLLAHTAFLISMALMVTGIGTFIQTKRMYKIGSGLVAIQGTSFAFISALILAGVHVRQQGGTDEDVLAMLFGLTLAGASIEILFSFFVQHLRRIITPLTTGIVITAIGLSLINVGMTDLAGGFNADSFGQTNNLLLGVGVLLVIVFLNASQNHWIRLSSIFIGMVLGYSYVLLNGDIDLSHLDTTPLFALPQPLHYGIDFDISLFVPVALIYLFSAIETAGDLTANSHFCKEPVEGPIYIERIRGGILGDGVNSLIAGLLNTFPNTTFGQNNGVIQLTGIASRKVGFYVAGMFVFVGMFPHVGAVLQTIPKPVLGGATLVMFAMVAVGGLKLLTSYALDRRSSLVTACSLGMCVGVMMVPDALSQLPIWLKNILSSPVTSAGLVAIFLDLTLPGKPIQQQQANTPQCTKLEQNENIKHQNKAA